MGNTSDKPFPVDFDESMHVDPEYFLSLQKYRLMKADIHDKLSAKTVLAETKPVPKPSVVATWSSAQLYSFIESVCIERYGSTFGGLQEVLGNFRAHLVDGSTVGQLRPEDWQVLCPSIGPRIWLMNRLKDATEKDTPPIHGGFQSPANHYGVKEVHGYEREPRMRWFHHLLWRSRFSYQRMIDTPWQPDPTLPWITQMWLELVHRILKLMFLIYASASVMISIPNLTFLLIPSGAITLCYFQKWMFNVSPALFVSIIVFPLTFSLNAAYNRREQALQTLSSMKTAALSIYLISGIWAKTQPSLPPKYQRTTSVMIRGIFRSYGHYLTAVNEAHRVLILRNTYQQYIDLFMHLDLFRLCGLPATLMSFPCNNMSNMMNAFEKLRVFSDYRTPCGMRSFFWICMVVLAVLMAPYTAYICKDFGLFFGYFVNLSFFWLMLSMNTVQMRLETPFSVYGESNAAEEDINLAVLRGGHAPVKAARLNHASPSSPGDLEAAH